MNTFFMLSSCNPMRESIGLHFVTVHRRATTMPCAHSAHRRHSKHAKGHVLHLLRVARQPVAVCFATTVAKRRPTAQNTWLAGTPPIGEADSAWRCTTSSGRRLCTDRSEAKTVRVAIQRTGGALNCNCIFIIRCDKSIIV